VETEKERGRKEVSLDMIAANNHYAGFGPGTANLLERWLVFRNYPGLTNNNYKRYYNNNVKVINKLANQTFLQKNTPRNDRVVSRNL
jgi:hypothetical protein